MDFDILCFTETHLNHNIEELFSLDGFYNPIRLDRTAFSSGLLTYISNKLLCNRLNELETLQLMSIGQKLDIKERILS